ncbi:unnamed protein product [Candidula unifasciata]|uniref:Uncharacterized protein n=1 Tax=Candidula unifasciata TaxID=100452 RepID=A0A8S3ZGJ4_9EUPU|nr:unnamed protein product [Candidula unifasciata]
MLSGLGIRDNLSLMPKLDHLIFWIEFYLTLTWMFISKVNHSSGKRVCFYLISSYLSNMHLLSECIENSEGHPKTVQELLTLHSVQRKQKRQILDRMDFIANFIVGHNRYSKFSLIDQVNQLCLGEQPNFLLAERIVVLSALVLLNIPGQYVYDHQEVPVRRELFKLHVTKVMPARLALLISGLKKASGYHDVAAVLLEFFHKQGSDRLITGQCLQQQNYSVQFHEAKFSDCPSLIFVDMNIEEEALKILKDSHEDQGINEELDEKDIERQEAKRKSADEENARKFAMKIIVQFLKGVVMQSRLQKKTFLTFEMDEMFRPYAVTDSSCGICGVALERSESTVSEGDESRSQLTKKKHCRTSDHKNNLQNFQTFKTVYASKVHHQREEILRFLSVHKVVNNSPVYKDELCTVKILDAVQKFGSSLENILHSRNWLSSQEMLEAFNTLTKCYRDNCDHIKKAYVEYQQKGEREHHNQDAAVKELIEQDRPQELVDIEPINAGKEPSDPRSTKQKKNTNKQNRRK